MVNALTEDVQRNQLILEELKKEATTGHFCMVLSERVDHCYTLNELSMKTMPHVSSEVLVGEVPQNQRQEIIEKLRNKKIQVLFATNKLAEEGLDLPHFDRLFLTCPSRNKGKVIQAVGRIMRLCDDKNDAVVFDFVDAKVGLLASQARSRRLFYQSIQ
jgi:superfamily II DNA or RNA helicase